MSRTQLSPLKTFIALFFVHFFHSQVLENSCQVTNLCGCVPQTCLSTTDLSSWWLNVIMVETCRDDYTLTLYWIICRKFVWHPAKQLFRNLFILCCRPVEPEIVSVTFNLCKIEAQCSALKDDIYSKTVSRYFRIAFSLACIFQYAIDR